MTTRCEWTFQCKEDWPSLLEQGWPGIRHCETCSRPVFLSANWKDADAIGRVGHCVALAESFEHPRIFVGLRWESPLSLGDFPVDVLIRIDRSQPDCEARAISDFKMYFSRLEGFERLLEKFISYDDVELPRMPKYEAMVWLNRLADWSIAVVSRNAA